MRTITFFAIAALPAAPLAGQQCPDDRPPYPSIGVERFQCRGGSCSVNRLQGDTYSHSFSTEPVVIQTWNRDSRGDDVMEGDVIVSVEGALITSREGGLRLGSLPIGEPAELEVRRHGQMIDLEVVPEASCDLPHLFVSSETSVALLASQYASAARQQGVLNQQLTSTRIQATQAEGVNRAALLGNYLTTLSNRTELTPPVEFGIELSCGDCAWTRSGVAWGRAVVVGQVPRATGTSETSPERHRTTMRFVTDEFPVIRAVERDGPADVAGVQIGDVILTVAGMPITSREAGVLLGEIEAGNPVTMELRRGNQIVSIDIVPREATEKRQKM